MDRQRNLVLPIVVGTCVGMFVFPGAYVVCWLIQYLGSMV